MRSGIGMLGIYVQTGPFSHVVVPVSRYCVRTDIFPAGKRVSAFVNQLFGLLTNLFHPVSRYSPSPTNPSHPAGRVLPWPVKVSGKVGRLSPVGRLVLDIPNGLFGLFQLLFHRLTNLCRSLTKVSRCPTKVLRSSTRVCRSLTKVCQ